MIQILRAIAAEINEKCSQPAKTWKEDTWKKSFFGPSNAQKEQAKKFKQAQDSWEKMYKKNVQLRDQFYKVCQHSDNPSLHHANFDFLISSENINSSGDASRKNCSSTT